MFAAAAAAVTVSAHSVVVADVVSAATVSSVVISVVFTSATSAVVKCTSALFVGNTGKYFFIYLLLLLWGMVTSPKTKAVKLPKRHIGEKNRRSHIAEK